MAEKKQAIGICDFCLGDIPPDLGNWTSKGTPRLHCSLVCRQTANSRAGNEERIAKVHVRVLLGEWQNPMHLRPPTPEEQSARSRKGRLREVADGTWRNPGLTDEAREINSRPHKHSGALASAIEKLKKMGMANLTPEEQEAYRAHARDLRAARKDESNAKRNAWYRKRQASMTPEQREAQREKWREGNRRKAERKSRSQLP